jgi:hypothetical protein
MSHAPRRKLERKIKETDQNSFGTTYMPGLIISAVALECAVVDLDICTTISAVANSSALEVACPPPGIGEKKVQESSNHLGTTRVLTVVAAVLLSNVLSWISTLASLVT